MAKKFFIYFAIFFVVIFSFLNSQYVSAEFRFWLDGGNEKIAQARVEEKKTLSLFDLIGKAFIKNEDIVGPYTLEVPIIDVKTPIVLESSTDPNKIFSRLEDGVVHYADSPLPGQKGTSIIIGHSSAYPWYKGQYGSVFALLGKLQKGDIIYVQGSNKTLTYEITDSLIFHALSANPQIDALVNTNNSSILLISCWPVGTAFNRIAVRADLVN